MTSTKALVIVATVLGLLTIAYCFDPPKPTPPQQVQFTQVSWDLYQFRNFTSIHYYDRLNHNLRHDYYNEKMTHYQTDYVLSSVGKKYIVKFGRPGTRCSVKQVHGWADPFAELKMMTYNGELAIPDGRSCDAWLANLDFAPLYLNITSCWSGNQLNARIETPDIGIRTFYLVTKWQPSLDPDTFDLPQVCNSPNKVLIN